MGSKRGGLKNSLVKQEEINSIKEGGGMGFRDLQFYNDALLSRRGWRFLHSPNSLVHKFLRAKYFP